MDRLIHDEIHRFLFEHSFDAILLTNPNGEVYRANPAACKLLQRSEEEICQLGRAGVVDLEDKRLQPALQE
ncbi:MAG: PAS domain-containing protein, partial [Eubacteriales bacterium]|nr:PAS domain-containing protein [Eubacteriales bacterium]